MTEQSNLPLKDDLYTIVRNCIIYGQLDSIVKTLLSDNLTNDALDQLSSVCLELSNQTLDPKPTKESFTVSERLKHAVFFSYFNNWVFRNRDDYD